MLQVTKRYMGSQTRKLLPDTPSFAGLYGDMDSARLNIEFPEVYNTYTKYVRFNVTLTDAEGNSYIPVYAMTDNSLIIPQEISNIYATEGNEDSVITFSVLLYYGDSLIETSLPGTIYFATTDDIVSTSTPHYTNILLRLAQEAFIQAEFSIDSIADRPIVTFSTISGTDTPITLEVPYLASGKIPTQFLPGSAVVDLFHITDPSELTTLTNAHTPDMAIVTAGAYTGNIYILTSDTPTTASDWAPMYSAVDATKLATIATGAQVNVIESISANGVALEITDKNVDITIPENLSDLNSDATHRTVSDTQISGWDAKQNALTFDNTPTQGSMNPVYSGGVYSADSALRALIDNKQDALTFDTAPIQNSSNPVTSGGVYDADIELQDNIDTEASTRASADSTIINNLNSEISARQGADSTLQNNINTEAQTRASADTILQDNINAKQDALTFDNTPTQGSTNPVTSGGIYASVVGKQDTLTFDNVPTADSSNPVKSGGVYSSLATKQDTLTFDSTPISGSSNPVTSGGVYTSVSGKVDKVSGKELSSNDFTDALETKLNGIDEGAQVNAIFTMPTPSADYLGKDYHFVGETAGGFVQNTFYTCISNGTDYLWSPSNPGVAGVAWGSISGILSSQKDLQTALDAKQNTLTFDDAPTSGSSNPVTSAGIYTSVSAKQDTMSAGTGISFSGTTINHSNAISAGTVGSDTNVPVITYDAQGHISGVSSATIYPPATAGTSGQIWQSRGSGIGIWQSLDATPISGSTVAITSGAVYSALTTKQNTLSFDNTPIASSTNPVTSGGVYSALDTKQDTLTAGSNITIESNVISAQIVVPPAGISDTFYMDSATTLSDTPPVSEVYADIVMSGTTGTSITLTYTLPEDRIISPTATYQFASNLRNITTGTVYTITATATYGTTIIATGTQSVTATDTSEYNVIAMSNQLSSNLNVVATGTVVLTFTISKDSARAQTAQLFSSPAGYTSFTRNGGNISANNVYDKVAGNNYTQASINSQFYSDIASKVTANGAITANTSSYVFPSYDTKGLTTGAIKTVYQKSIYLNGTDIGFITDQYNSDITVYSPTTAGTSGQYLISTGGVPSWATLDLSGYQLKNNLITAFQTTPDNSHYPSELLVYTQLNTKQGTLTFDSTPTTGSANPVTSGGVYSALSVKQNTITGGASTITTSNLTANRALLSNSSGKVAVSAVTSTELGYMSGVTSAIQTQINGKQDALTFDSTPTVDSAKPVTSDGIYRALTLKQDTMSAGTGISLSGTTINHEASITAGSVGSALSVPIITYNTTGHITAISSATIYPPTTAGTAGQYWMSDGAGAGAWQSLATSAISDSGVSITSGAVYTALAGKQNTLTFDSAPTSASSNPVTSGGVYAALAGKQATLSFDATPTLDSTNPVTSGGVYSSLSGKQDNISAGTGLTLSGATVNHASSITAGSVGSATLVPIITFNGTGHITATSTATIYPPTSAGTSGQYWRSDGSGQGVWQSMITAPTSGSAYAITAGAVYTALSDKQDTLTFDNTPTSASTNPVTSGGVYTALSGKQATLTFDSAPTSGSANPVTSDGIYTAINTKATTVTYTGTVSTTWTGSSAPYSQMITINGILATDNPIIDVVLSSTWATAILQSEAWTKIQRIVTSANTLTVYATEATTTAIPIQIKVVR